MVSKKATFSLVIYISRTKTKQNGEVPVLMKININGERAVMQLQRSIHPDKWDNQRSRASGRSNEANEFNRYIESVLTRSRQKYSELITMHETVTPHLLRDAIISFPNSEPFKISGPRLITSSQISKHLILENTVVFN